MYVLLSSPILLAAIGREHRTAQLDDAMDVTYQELNALGTKKETGGLVFLVTNSCLILAQFEGNNRKLKVDRKPNPKQIPVWQCSCTGAGFTVSQGAFLVAGGLFRVRKH